jgi:hypothetical protein
VPDNLYWAPIDFERHTLTEVLREAGFDASLPASFSGWG